MQITASSLKVLENLQSYKWQWQIIKLNNHKEEEAEDLMGKKQQEQQQQQQQQQQRAGIPS